MKKCPNCGWHPEDDLETTTLDEYSQASSFKDFMNKKLKESAKRMRKETDYGIPDKKKDMIKFNEPKIFKGELDHVEREN